MAYKEIYKTTTEEYIEYLKKLDAVFKEEDIGECTKHYIDTTKSIFASEHMVIANICKRLIQGKVFVYPINKKDNYPLLATIKDEDIEKMVEVSWGFVKKKCVGRRC